MREILCWVLNRAVWGVVALSVWKLCEHYESKPRHKQQRVWDEIKHEIKRQEQDDEEWYHAARTDMEMTMRYAQAMRSYEERLRGKDAFNAVGWCMMYKGAGSADCELCLHRESDGWCRYKES